MVNDCTCINLFFFISSYYFFQESFKCIFSYHQKRSMTVLFSVCLPPHMGMEFFHEYQMFKMADTKYRARRCQIYTYQHLLSLPLHTSRPTTEPRTQMYIKTDTGDSLRHSRKFLLNYDTRCYLFFFKKRIKSY